MTDLAENRPIFVVGFPRSGTTLLQSLLGAHPRIAAPPELFFGRRVLQFGEEYWGDLNDDAALRRVVEETLSLPNLSTSGFDVDRVIERAQRGPRTLSGVFDAVMSDYTERNGKARWSEKSPMQDARAIWRFFPHAQVVHIVRDPRPTVASNLTKLGGWPDLLSTSAAWRSFTLDNVLAGAEAGPERYLRIRYEDLAGSPGEVMKLVFTFLSEDFDADYVSDPQRRRGSVGHARDLWQARVLQPIAPADDGWRKEIGPLARLRLCASVDGVLPGLGYSPISPAATAAGRVLNVPFFAVFIARRVLAWSTAKRLRTAEQRYRAEQRAHAKRGRRMRRVLSRRSGRGA